MRNPLGVLLFSVATVLASIPAFGTASATITVNGNSRSLSETGFLLQQIGGPGVNLAPGQSADFTFEYSISVQDSGLPVAFDQKAVGCIAIFPTPCNDAYTGFEYAKAYLLVVHEDPRVGHNPAVVQEGIRSSATLATHGDSFAEALTKSGVLHAHIEVLDVPGANTFSNVYSSYIALWVLASPIPEPEILAQMLAGLALIASKARHRKKARPKGEIPCQSSQTRTAKTSLHDVSQPTAIACRLIEDDERIPCLRM